MAETLLFWEDNLLFFDDGTGNCPLAMESDVCCCEGTPDPPDCGDCTWMWTVPAGPWVLVSDDCIFADCECPEPTNEPASPSQGAEETLDCIRN